MTQTDTGDDHNGDFNAVEESLPTFAWILNTADIRSFNDHKVFTASQEQLSDLATHLGLMSLGKFQINCTLKAKKTGGVVELTTTLHASGNQTCVVSGEPIPFKDKLHETLLYTTEKPSDLPSGHHLEDRDFERPEYLENGRLDVLRVGIEILSLNLDPFPRKDGAEFKMSATEELETEGTKGASKDDTPGENDKPNPFAVLQSLKDKM